MYSTKLGSHERIKFHFITCFVLHKSLIFLVVGSCKSYLPHLSVCIFIYTMDEFNFIVNIINITLYWSKVKWYYFSPSKICFGNLENYNMIPVKRAFVKNHYVVGIINQKLDSFRLQNNWHLSFQLMWDNSTKQILRIFL